MELSEMKNWLKRSLDPWAPADDIPELLEKEGISFDFSQDFNRKISERLAGMPAPRLQAEFLGSLNYVFTRFALTGVAAILILLLSIFLTQGTLSLDSVLGLSDSSEESMVFLLTGI